MGQSIRWHWKGNDGDGSINSSLKSTEQQLSGSEHFLKKKSGFTIEEITLAGFTPKTLDPHEMFLDYIQDTAKMMAVQDLIKKSIATKIDGKQIATYFTSKNEAIREGYTQLSDEALRQVFSVNGEPVAIFKKDGTTVEDENGVVLFNSREDAQAYLDRNFSQPIGRDYLGKDLRDKRKKEKSI